MKFLFDLFPVLVFFAAYRIAALDQEAAAASATHFFGWMASSGVISPHNGPTTWATIATVISTVSQITWLKLRKKHIDMMLIITFVVVVTLGSATVWFQNDTFIRVKPTVVYWVMALAFIVAEWVFKKNLARAALGKAMQLPDPVWRKLLLAWIVFFIFLGALNLYVALNYSMETWVNFKLFGVLGLPFVFAIVQTLMIAKYILPEEQE
jgi:intracellular septation protein